MTKAFEVPSTPCTFEHMNVRTEKHGEDNVTALDLKFSGITLSKDMLNEFLGDKHAHDALFQQKKAGAVIEPMFPYFDAFKFDGKFEDCVASVRFGMQKTDNELEDVKFASIKLEPLTGGHTAMTLTVQYELEDTDIVGDFAEYLGSEVHLGLVFGKKADPNAKKQQSLPLNSEPDKAVNKFGEGEAPPATH